MKFKIGDYVKILSCDFYPNEIGKTGHVTFGDKYATVKYRVTFNNDLWHSYHERELQLVDLTIFNELGT